MILTRALDALIRRIEELGAGGEQVSQTSADREQRAGA